LLNKLVYFVCIRAAAVALE